MKNKKAVLAGKRKANVSALHPNDHKHVGAKSPIEVDRDQILTAWKNKRKGEKCGSRRVRFDSGDFHFQFVFLPTA